MKKITTITLLIFSSLFFALILAEVSLRLLNISYPNFYTPNEHLGYTLRPNTEGPFTDEGGAYIKINDKGLRSAPVEYNTPVDTIRIALIGDSFAEALQVEIQDAFWSVLENKLNQCYTGNHKVEIINFGVGGYGTAQELLMLKHYVDKFSPDLVLLAYFAGNDIRNNLKALEKDDARPYYNLVNNELVLDDSFLNSSSYLAKQSGLGKIANSYYNDFRLLELMGRLRKYLKKTSQQQSRDVAAEQNNTHWESGLSSEIYMDNPPQPWPQAWNLTEMLLIAIRDEAHRIGSELIIIAIPDSIQAHPDANLRESFKAHLGIDDLNHPEKRLQSLAKRENFTTVPLAEPMRAQAEAQQIYYYGFENARLGSGHWNSAGHQFAGNHVANMLCNQPELFAPGRN